MLDKSNLQSGVSETKEALRDCEDHWSSIVFGWCCGDCLVYWTIYKIFKSTLRLWWQKSWEKWRPSQSKQEILADWHLPNDYHQHNMGPLAGAAGKYTDFSLTDVGVLSLQGHLHFISTGGCAEGVPSEAHVYCSAVYLQHSSILFCSSGNGKGLF